MLLMVRVLPKEFKNVLGIKIILRTFGVIAEKLQFLRGKNHFHMFIFAVFRFSVPIYTFRRFLVDQLW